MSISIAYVVNFSCPNSLKRDDKSTGVQALRTRHVREALVESREVRAHMHMPLTQYREGMDWKKGIVVGLVFGEH